MSQPRLISDELQKFIDEEFAKLKKQISEDFKKLKESRPSDDREK